MVVNVMKDSTAACTRMQRIVMASFLKIIGYVPFLPKNQSVLSILKIQLLYDQAQDYVSIQSTKMTLNLAYVISLQ